MLSTEERAVLDFESTWWIEDRVKDRAVEARLGLSSAAYYELLLALIERPEAITYDPLTVLRVKRMIDPAHEPFEGVGS